MSAKFKEYLKLNQVCYTGPIAVELYQSAKTYKEIHITDQLLQTITYTEITRTHYHRAGLMSQKAAREGKSFSTIDMTLATVAHDEQLQLFSLDTHFQDISRYCALSLVLVGAGFIKPTDRAQ